MKRIAVFLLLTILLSLSVSCVRPPTLETSASGDPSLKTQIPASADTPVASPTNESTEYAFPTEYLPSGAVIPDERMPEPPTDEYESEALSSAPAFHWDGGDGVPGALPVTLRTHNVYYDHCLYYLIDCKVMKNGVQTDTCKVWKYDLLTDTCTPACADPGCAHDGQGCISYDLNITDDRKNYPQLITVDERLLYFRAGSDVYRYDLKTAKTEFFTETVDHLKDNVSLTPYKDAMYMTARRLPKNGDDLHTERVLIKIDKQTKNAVEVVNFGTSMDTLTAIANDRLYINHNNVEYYTLDLSGKDKQSLLEEKWLWQGEPASDGSYIWSNIWQFQDIYYKSCMIHRLDPASREDKVLCGYPIAQYFVTEKYIYYIPRYENDQMTKCVPLMRMDHDGGGKTLVLWLHDTSVDSFLVDGDVLLVDSTVFRMTEDGGYIGDLYILVFDLVTGAYTKIGSGEWYK